jgi:hypothetical protein
MTDFGSRHKASHQDGGGDEISVAGLSGLLADEQDAGEIKGVAVDDTDKGDGKSLNYNETSEKLEYETPAAGGDTYVDRGDPSFADWTQTTLTTDSSWNNLDCSAIVPAGTKAILFEVELTDNTAGGKFEMRKKGNSYSTNKGLATQTVANLNFGDQLLIPCDANRIVQYRGTNKAWTNIQLTICGWFV